jgi:hypothetical protein
VPSLLQSCLSTGTEAAFNPLAFGASVGGVLAGFDPYWLVLKFAVAGIEGGHLRQCARSPC